MYAKNIKLLSIFNFLTKFSLYAPIAIIYFSRVSGSYALGASVMGIVMLFAAILELPTGVWSDRVGRRMTIILGSWTKVLAVIFYAIGLSYGFLVIGAILEGLARSLYSGNNDAFLHDTLEDGGKADSYSKFLGRTMSFEHLAVGIGSLAGGIIATFSFAWLMWLSVIPQIIKLIVSYKFVEPRSRIKIDTNIYAHTKDAIKLFVKNKQLRLLTLSEIMKQGLGESSYQFRAAFFASLWPLWAIGVAHTLTNFSAALSFYFSDKVLARISRAKLLVVRSIVGRVTLLFAYGLPSIYSPLIVVLPSFLYGSGQVAKNSLMQDEFTDHQRATMSSLNSLAGSLGFATVSILIGLFADKTNPATALFTITLVSIPGIYIYWKIFKTNKS